MLSSFAFNFNLLQYSMVAVGHSSQLRTGSTEQAGRAVIFGGHGCLKGENYFDATKSKVGWCNLKRVESLVEAPGVSG
jgi:hypothetical protein